MLAALKFLVGSCQHVFCQCYYETVLLSVCQNGHLDFSSGFQVIDLLTTKNAKIAQKPWALV